MDVTLYARPGCGECRKAREYLANRQIDFTERDITRDAAARLDLEALAAPGVPVIVIDGRAVLGFEAERIDDLLKAKQ